MSPPPGASAPNPSPLPPAFDRPSPLPPAFDRPAEAPSPWARSVMPDGREVPDAPVGSSGPLAWRTEGSKIGKKALPKLAALLAALFGFAAYNVARIASADPTTRLLTFAGTFVASFALLYFALGFLMRKQLSGAGSLSVMYLPPHLATPDAAGRLVYAAAGAMGRAVRGPSKIRAVYYWDLDAPVRFYFNPMFGPSKTFLSIKTGSPEQADLYRRLKGHILAMTAAAPAAAPLGPAGTPP